MLAAEITQRLGGLQVRGYPALVDRGDHAAVADVHGFRHDHVGTVIRLPLYVFVRSYNLYFLAQLGGDLERFGRLGDEGLAEVFE